MPSETYIAIFGLFGSGKTTLARGIIGTDGGAVDHDNYCVTNGGLYTFFGTYKKDSKYGGADVVKDNTSAKLKEAFLRSETPIFISEGVRIQSFGPLFLQTFYLAKRQAIIALDCDPDVTLARIAERSGKTGENSNRKSLPTFNRLLGKFVSIGTPVFRINANQDKDAVLQQSLEIIRSFL